MPHGRTAFVNSSLLIHLHGYFTAFTVSTPQRTGVKTEMKLNNRFIFGLLSLLLAAVTAFVALPVIARQTNGKTEIIRVTMPILKGEKVSAANTETVEVGSYNLPAGIARSLEDIDGLYATADLSPGDYILPAKVSPVPVSSDAVLNSIPSGKVAISLTIQTLASGLSDKLQPGDIIRIYHFLDVAMEVPELRFVKVLSVTDAGGMNVDNAREPLEDEEKQQSATVTVLASPEQARIITLLENDGVAHVALVNRSNEKLAEELLTEQELTLQEIYFPETLVPEEENVNSADGEPADGTGNAENIHNHDNDNPTNKEKTSYGENPDADNDGSTDTSGDSGTPASGSGAAASDENNTDGSGNGNSGGSNAGNSSTSGSNATNPPATAR